MEHIPPLIDSVAILLWPLIVIVVLFQFRPAVGALIESAKSRKFTLKIGGQELTMDEVNQQQRGLIADLQTQVIELQKKIGSFAESEEVTATVAAADMRSQLAHTVLWVDDNPKNNTYFIAELGDLGMSVDIALSTSEGVSKFEHGNYRFVISDMGRKEDGKFNRDAGLDLLQAIREQDAEIPFVIFCSRKGVSEFRSKAMELGATGITASATELFAKLGLDQARHGA